MSFWLKVAQAFSGKKLEDVQPEPKGDTLSETSWGDLNIDHFDYTCSGCKWDSECELAYDPYNTGGDCLQMK